MTKSGKKSKHMNVLLKQDIYNLGRKGDIARAKNGYAAYLIRTNQAVLPTKGILYLKKRLQEERLERRNSKYVESSIVSSSNNTFKESLSG